MNFTGKTLYIPPKIEVKSFNSRHSILLASNLDFKNEQLGGTDGWGDDFWG